MLPGLFYQHLYINEITNIKLIFFLRLRHIDELGDLMSHWAPITDIHIFLARLANLFSIPHLKSIIAGFMKAEEGEKCCLKQQHAATVQRFSFLIEIVKLQGWTLLIKLMPKVQQIKIFSTI